MAWASFHMSNGLESVYLKWTFMFLCFGLLSLLFHHPQKAWLIYDLWEMSLSRMGNITVQASFSHNSAS